MACRHHIPELICGAACKCVYGDTESPDESCFVAFAKAWNGINKESYNLPSITSSYLKTLQSQTTDFLTEFLTSEQATLRHDYKELGTLTLLYLGGTLPSGIKIYAPGAHHHARWMSKIIYTLKIALFRDQLGVDMIQNLATFLALFYVKYWFCAPNPVDAPQLDLDTLKLLEQAKRKVKSSEMLEMIDAALIKLKSHLWYLSERLVPFALLSHRVTTKDKAEMAKEILKFRDCPQVSECQQLMPEAESFGNKKLKDFVGDDSWTFLNLMCGGEPQFLSLKVAQWDTDPSYQSLLETARSIKVVNDSAERALGMVTEYHIDRITRSEEQRGYLHQVIRELRLRQKTASDGRLDLSKKVMKMLDYKL